MSGRVCVFCGGSPVTRAHLVARRIAAALPPHEFGTRRTELGGAAVAASAKSYDASPFEETVKALCGPCNREWMAPIEGLATQLIADLAGERALVLSQEDQEHLDTWFALVTMLRAEADGVPRMFSDAEYRWVREQSAALPSAHLWLMHVASDSWFFSRHQRFQVDGQLTHVTVYGFNHVAFVSSTTAVVELMALLFAPLGDAVVPLVPGRGVVAWPPRTAIAPDVVQAFTSLR